MSKAIENLLESVARATTEAAKCSCEDCYNNTLAVLRERLQPLLEAGQAMRERHQYGEGSEMLFDGAWDAALAAGKGRA